MIRSFRAFIFCVAAALGMQTAALAVPFLQNGSVTPVLGTRTQTYTFSVFYSNNEGDPPTNVRLFINGEQYPTNMTRVGSGAVNWQNPVEYRIQVPFSPFDPTAIYRFHFVATVDDTSARFPVNTSQFLDGPTLNDPPTLFSGSTSASASQSASLNYSVSYRDINGDIPDPGYPVVWVGNKDGWQFNGGVITVLNPSVTLITDASKNWTPSQFRNQPLNWKTGARVGRTDTIIDNTANMLFVNTALDIDGFGTPVIGDQFQINEASGQITALDLRAAALTDSAKDYAANSLAGGRIQMVNGNGFGNVYAVVGNTNRVIAVGNRLLPTSSQDTDFAGAGIVSGDMYSNTDILAGAVTSLNLDNNGLVSLQFNVNPNWTANQFAGLALYVMDGAAAGTAFTIFGNTTNTITFTQGPLDFSVSGIADGDLVRIAGLSTEISSIQGMLTDEEIRAILSAFSGASARATIPNGLGVGTHTARWVTANSKEVGAQRSTFQAWHPATAPLERPVVTENVPLGNELPRLRNAGATPLRGTTLSNFDFSVDYIDPEGDAPGPHGGVVGNITLIIEGAGIQRVYRSGVDPLNDSLPWPVPANANSPADAAWRTINVAEFAGFRVSAGTLAPGTYRYHFEASDGWRKVRFPSNPETDPAIVVNSKPILTSPSVSPGEGNTGTNFRFRVVYTDADNQAPSTINLVVNKDGADQAPVALTKEDSSDINFIDGAIYYADRVLGAGTYTYRFTAADDLEAASPTFAQSGPIVRGNNAAPVLIDGAVTPLASAAIGNSFDYTVRFQDPDGDTPNFVRVTILDTDGSTILDTIDMEKAVPSDNTFGDADGVLYQVLGYTFSGSGLYSYQFSASDGLQNATGDNAVKSGPRVNDPPQITAGAAPANGLSSELFTFTLTYRDSDDVAPTEDGYVRIVLTPQTGSVITENLVAQASTGWAAGVTYTLQRQLPPGVYSYYFTASDGLDPAPNTPTIGGLTVTAAPELRNAAVTPSIGTLQTVFTYSVVLANPDGTGPSSIKVFIDGNAPANGFTMERVNLTDNFVSGVQYRYQTTLPAGAHTWYIEAQLAGETLYPAGQAPNSPASGPTVNNPPVLTNATVSPGFGRTDTPFTFSVIYTDADGVGPTSGGYVRVRITGRAQPLVLTPSGSSWTTGVVYSATTTLPGGVSTYYIEASDGVQAIRLPEGAGLFDTPRVSSPPVLSSGSVTPTTGTTSTVFVYRVTYTDADNDPPATDSVKVVIDGTPRTMSQLTSSDTNYLDGAVFTYSTTLGTGSHNYRFQASDGIDSTVLPSSGVISGPSVDVGGVTLNVSPNPVVLGNQVTFTGTVSPARTTTLTLNLQKPGGTNVTRSVSTNSSGAYTISLVVDEVGNWTGSITENGNSSVTANLSPVLTVQPVTLRVQGDLTDMISSPIMSATGDPGDIFGFTEAINLRIVRWDPTTATYKFYGAATDFPVLEAGSAFWIKPLNTVTLTFTGTLLDQNLPITVPVSAGWNQIGSGFVRAVNWGDIQVRYLGQTYSLAQATANNWVRDYAWGYNPLTRQYFVVRASDGNSTVLDPFRGYWFRSFVECELIITPTVN